MRWNLNLKIRFHTTPLKGLKTKKHKKMGNSLFFYVCVYVCVLCA